VLVNSGNSTNFPVNLYDVKSDYDVDMCFS